MRRFLHILLLLLPLIACTRELNPVMVPEEPEDDAPEGTVLVDFSFSVPAEDPATKALGEESQLQTMHLAIFGSSGYYKDYREATALDGYPKKELRTFYREDGTDYKKEVDIYAFQAEVTLANTARVIHFIGNGPSTIHVGNAAEVLPSELSGEGKTGFWQMVRLPAIKAKTAIGKDENDNEYEYFVDQNGGVYGDDPNDRYVISDETKKYFQFHLKRYDENGNPEFSTERGIPLIRNWAKVTLKNAKASNFTPISFAVVHVPKQGTLVPYGGKTGFIPDYQDMAFDDLMDSKGLYAYKGNLPEKENLFDETIPDAKYFDGRATGNVNVKQYDIEYDSNWTTEHVEGFSEDNEPAVYLYERPVPTDNMQPSFVIVYGTYFRADDPVFMAANAGDGWPTREEYKVNPTAYTSTYGDAMTNDNSLTFKEYYEGVKCYYKVDFMADGEYYPILRNFKYQVEISSISARGHSTPEDAAHSAGSADVSANINTAHLADISDGNRRMVVQPWIAQSFIKADNPDGEVPVHLHVKFFDDINAGDKKGINYDEERTDSKGEIKRCVTWSFVEDHDNGVISNISIGPAPEPENLDSYDSDVHGWRPVYFRVLEPDKHVVKTQTLRIKCMSYLRDPITDELVYPDEQPLYRDIVITLLPKQEMRVRCERPSIPKQIQESQTVTISIPDGLPRSMFPLEFILEPEKATLTPSTATDTENLPVSSGKSIIPGKEEKTAIQFKRSVSWELYKNTASQDVFSDETRWRSFQCHFVSNCSDSKTVVWVADKAGYFLAGIDNEQAHAGFTNYSSFHTPVFKTSIPREIPADSDPANVQVETGVYTEDLGKDNFFFMEAVNLTPVSAEGATFEPVEGEDDLYKFVPSAPTIVFDFKTQVADGNVSLKFRAVDEDYREESLAPRHFRNVGIVDGLYRSENDMVAYRHVSDADKNFLVSCTTDQKEDDLFQITVKNWNGVVENSSNFSIGNYYHEKWFQTEAGTGPVSLTLSAVGYVEESVSASRYRGFLYNWDITSNTLKGLADGAVIRNDVTQNQVTGSFSLNISSTVGGLLPTANNNGILLPAGGHYKINADIGSNSSDVFLYYAQIYYLLSSGGTPQKPYDSSVEPQPDGSSYSVYHGNADENVYMWTIPWGETAGSLEMTAPANQNIVITRVILRGFHGILYDSSDTGGDIGFGEDLNEGGGL